MHHLMGRHSRRHGRPWRTAYAGTAFALIAVVTTPAVALIELSPHRAIYEVSLLKTNSGGNVSNARGAVSLEWRESCDGWKVDQRFRLQLAMEGGRDVQTDIAFSSFEQKDGTKYTFNSKTTRNGRQTRRFKGEVERAGPDAAAVARYSLPSRQSLSLPAGTLFPMQHTQAMLDAAARGDRQISAKFFEGPRPEESPFDASALILGGPQDAKDGVAGAYGKPIDLNWWRVRVAYFTSGTNNSEPDFELGIDLQEDGIAQGITFDYRDFSLAGKLVVAERLDRPSCP